MCRAKFSRNWFQVSSISSQPLQNVQAEISKLRWHCELDFTLTVPFAKGSAVTRLAGYSAIAILLFFGSNSLAENWMLQINLSGKQLEGSPLLWTHEQALLLGRDGHLWSFDPREGTDLKKSSPSFRGYSQADLRGRLLTQFGRQFEVTGTGHFLVVHPSGQRAEWANRFEELYRSFIHYFTVRGFRPSSPKYPLIAVVFSDRDQFLRYSLKKGIRVPASGLGYYSPTSNRILLYDQRGAGNSATNWKLTAITVIHEAAHQSAFNTGVHNRFAPQPRWLVEGLGMMFEAKGVYDSRRYPNKNDRINQGRLASFKYALPKRPKDALATLIASDRLFQTDPYTAYAEAWALSFYLVEMQPQKYFEFLAKTAGREAFAKYPAPQRVKDFTDTFGENLALLDAQMIRFIKSLD